MSYSFCYHNKPYVKIVSGMNYSYCYHKKHGARIVSSMNFSYCSWYYFQLFLPPNKMVKVLFLVKITAIVTTVKLV